MIEIGRDALGGVTGGEASTTTVNTPLVQTSQTETNYARCVREVVAQTAKEYPPTNSWNPFASDTNEVPRAEATMRNMRSTCGLPPP